MEIFVLYQVNFIFFFFKFWVLERKHVCLGLSARPNT